MPIKTQYTVKTGDTSSAIAKNYQITVEQLITANPNVYTPDRPKDGSLIFPGDVLNIPTGEVDNIRKLQTIKTDAEDELTILIDGKKCPLPHEFEFIEYFDACSDSFQLTYPYNPELKNPAYLIDLENFKTKGLPFMDLYIGSDPALSGSVEIPSNKITPSFVSQSLAGRSGTFLLEKSDILPNIKREYLNLSLPEVAEIVAGAYSIGVEIQSGLNLTEPFSKVTIEDNEKPFVFLSRLALERGVLLGKTGDGKLLIHKAVKSTPVALFKINQEFLKFIGVTELEFTFDTREIYGQYEGKTSAIDNPNLTSTVKSKTLNQQSIKITNFSDATAGNLSDITAWEEQKAIREFYKNALPFPSWLNPNTGKKWRTGDIIILEAPEVGIVSQEMLIRSIRFTLDSSERREAVLNIIPVEVYL